MNKQLVCSSGETIAPTLSVIQLPVALCVGLKPHKRLPLHWHSHCDFNIELEKAILIHESSLKITGENDTSFSFAFRDKVKMLVNKMIYFHVFQEWILKGQVKQNYPGDSNHYYQIVIYWTICRWVHDPSTSVVFKGLGYVLKDKLKHCVVFKIIKLSLPPWNTFAVGRMRVMQSDVFVGVCGPDSGPTFCEWELLEGSCVCKD